MCDPAPMVPYPVKLFVETTTRCNLQCPMCVKQSAGNRITDADLSLDCFRCLDTLLPNIEVLQLNGIGEPLLHPDLETMISEAKSRMPAHGVAGFQTNGHLMDRKRALSLISAGLDRVCISVDAADPDTFRQFRHGGELSGVQNAFDAINHARRQLKAHELQIGVEFVLGKDNMYELPATVEWAVQQGASFAIVTHMIAYDAHSLDKVAYDQNTDAAVEFFQHWNETALTSGINIGRYFDVRWKYHRNASEQQVVDFVDHMLREAADQDIFFHLRRMLERDSETYGELREIFDQTANIAKRHGLTLTLPAMAPRAEKKCDFMASASMFVAVNGDVHPCYFLWHQYTCHVAGWHKYVTPRIFGNLNHKQPLEIWNQDDYTAFRRQVLEYDYPLCSNCSLAPCDYIEVEMFEQDCYTNTIPCCDCQWCLGVFQCMQ